MTDVGPFAVGRGRHDAMVPGDRDTHRSGGEGPRGHMLHGDTAPSADGEARRCLKQRLADAVRRLSEHAALVDVEKAETVDEIEGVVERIDRAASSLATVASLRDRSLADGTLSWQFALTERGPVSGRSNPVAPPLHVETDGVSTWGNAEYDSRYEGPPGCLHGGWVAAAFDEVLGVAQDASGQVGLTANLVIRMRRPTPLHTRIDYEGGVSRSRPGRWLRRDDE